MPCERRALLQIQRTRSSLAQVVRYVLRGGVVQVPHVAAVVLGVGWVAQTVATAFTDALGWKSLLWPRQVLQDVQPLLVGDLHAAQDVPSLARLVEGVQRLVERIAAINRFSMFPAVLTLCFFSRSKAAAPSPTMPFVQIKRNAPSTKRTRRLVSNELVIIRRKPNSSPTLAA